ncbi:MAG TPA: hypothetical protein PKY56_08080 [Candidatus Kapabacteria bacterium]|nr:hypothetical protein [Candidatus Kapabacteria bacterium]HPO62893.1 hypothetical protein [Candidatus Kapabacteria bacterium]
MSFFFSKEDVKKIEEVLETQAQEVENSFSWRLSNPKSHQALSFTIFNEVQLGGDSLGTLISVQTNHGYFELHNCTNYMIFEPEEVIFINQKNEVLSSLIIGKNCTCSLFSNINKHILNADFNTLDPSVLLAAMQLSLTESIFY